MAYDEKLAQRIRQAFGTRRDIAARKMFGGLTFLCRGRMCCGIVGADLMVRVAEDQFDEVGCHPDTVPHSRRAASVDRRRSFGTGIRPGRYDGLCCPSRTLPPL